MSSHWPGQRPDNPVRIWEEVLDTQSSTMSFSYTLPFAILKYHTLAILSHPGVGDLHPLKSQNPTGTFDSLVRTP